MRRGRRTAGGAVAVLVIAGGLGLAPAGPAAAVSTITVTTTDDIPVAPGAAISLREAIAMSATDGDETVIMLATSSTYLLDECGLTDGGTLISAPGGDLTIDGRGSTVEQTCADAGVMSIDAELGDFRLEDITITGGDRSAAITGHIGGGVGVAHADSATILNVTFRANHTDQSAGGGGLYVSDPIPATITRTSFLANTSASGASATQLRGTSTITESAFVDNNTFGASGGTVQVDAPSLTVTNSTFADNSPGSGSGAALSMTTGALTVTHSTIAGPETQVASGGAVTFAGTALYKTSLASVCGVDTDLVTSLGHNDTNDASCGMDHITDVFDPLADPMLRAVFRNGGTPSFYPEQGSPLIDRVPADDPEIPPADQRGVSRPQASAADIGSIEVAECDLLFFDVDLVNPFCWEIGWLSGSGVTTGFPDGGFHPGEQVTRASMAAFMYRLAGFELGPDPTCTSAPFPDVPTSHVFCGEITWLVDDGITTGGADGKYHPTDVVSRQSMAAFMYRLAGSPFGPNPGCGGAPFPDVPVSHVFCGEIQWLAGEEVTGGFPDGGFHPTGTVSRQSMAAFMYRLADGLIG